MFFAEKFFDRGTFKENLNYARYETYKNFLGLAIFSS